MTNETKILILVAGVSLLILIGGAWFYQNNQGTAPSDTLTANREALVRDDSMKEVAPNEKVVVVEFADYQCPACAYIAPYMKELREEYKDSVTFVYRDFPLTSIHKNAIAAAQAARIAGEQGKYWEMHDKLFAAQKEWENLGNPTDMFVSYAQEIGMNTDGLADKLKSNAYRNQIQADTRDGELLGVNSTPTFFIGDTIVRSANYDAIKSAIDAHLAEVD